MRNKPLKGLKVAVLATDGFEESELRRPVMLLRRAGARVDVIAPKPDKIMSFNHHDKSTEYLVDCTLGEAKPENYDALMLPGGALNTDQLRVIPEVKAFVKSISESGKPISAICHAAWVLISAGIVAGRELTSYHTIRDDVVNAGGIWQDREVLRSGKLLTSRKPDDLPAFNREMIQLFSESLPQTETKAA